MYYGPASPSDPAPCSARGRCSPCLLKESVPRGRSGGFGSQQERPLCSAGLSPSSSPWVANGVCNVLAHEQNCGASASGAESSNPLPGCSHPSPLIWGDGRRSQTERSTPRSDVGACPSRGNASDARLRTRTRRRLSWGRAASAPPARVAPPPQRSEEGTSGRELTPQTWASLLPRFPHPARRRKAGRHSLAVPWIGSLGTKSLPPRAL